MSMTCPQSGVDAAPAGATRRVCSFVRREGRMTAAQRRALTALWPSYGVELAAGLLDLDALFERRAPRVLEIGFGMGDALLAMAAAHPEHDYLGIEVYRPGIGRLLNRLAADAIGNVRVFSADAVEVLERCIPDAALAAVCMFFPDPWPKQRHRKRRLVQPAFATLLARKLDVGGRLYLATDWEDYAGQMLSVLGATPALCNLAGPGLYAPRPAERSLTKFELRGQCLGHGVWDLIFERCA